MEAVKLVHELLDYAASVIALFPAAHHGEDTRASMLSQAREDARRQREQIKALAAHLK